MNSRPPYPGYPPSYRRVDKTGGFTRTCLVLEILSLGGLTDAELTHVTEQLEAAMARILPAVIEKSQVVTQDRFDRLLLDGLRLS